MTALVALSVCDGCSFLFVQPPKDDVPSRGAGDCTTSAVAPVVDSLFALTNAVSAAYVASLSNEEITNKGPAIGLGLGVAAVWLASAIYGYYNTSRCVELVRDRAAEPFLTGYRPPASLRPVVSIPAEETADAGSPDPMPGFEN